ncbi:MAG: gamma-glutamylcyclotransferase family protein [Bacteroidota bacterium]
MPLEYLFTYGTLQNRQVQQYVFGRILKGIPDHITGYKYLENAIYQRYPLVQRSNNMKHTVKGMVYELSKSDLLRCDVYETSAYKREKVILQSGTVAWVYIENSG